jgi:hypothetical protein
MFFVWVMTAGQRWLDEADISCIECAWFPIACFVLIRHAEERPFNLLFNHF